MTYLLDILGSTVIGAFVILMVINFNVQLTTFSTDMLFSTLTQSDAVVGGQIMEYDLYKIGYRIPAGKIEVADSIQLTYLTDLQNNGNTDRITYSVGTIEDMTSSSNPVDRPLLRTQNDQTAIKIADISKFKISYFDSSGTELNSLGNQIERDKIRTIKVDIRFEAPEKMEDYYQGVDWERIIRPKNLN